ncbi:hypothetical protein C8Q75DRAFT_562618 [Abortiporus biennis]|nr:hypothetical protein C8Q75DRAFT_562618 [Abortiporus biennis]
MSQNAFILSSFVILGSLYYKGHVYLSLLFSIAVGCLAFLLRENKLGDPYGTFHVSLNERRKGEQPTTEWLNMGYWKDTQSFPEACEALALKLHLVADCKPGGCVLDVGHGSGDSLLLQLSCPIVPRPSKLVGITSLDSHYKRSMERVADFKTTCEGDIPEIFLFHGDAIYRQHEDAMQRHPLNPQTLGQPYSTILALDCAYHFRTRLDFLQQCFSCLEPGGTVALADICFRRKPSWLTTKLIKAMGVMPEENIVDTETYFQTMKNLGYTDIVLEDITDDVFPGFEQFLRSRGILWRLFAGIIHLLAHSGACFVIVKGKKPQQETSPA